jgi:hypothetical protein
MEKSSSQQISTRRKSCVACVKAKRRCDLQQPHCTRCGTRNLLCNYVSLHLDLETGLARGGLLLRKPYTNPGGIDIFGPQIFGPTPEYLLYTDVPTAVLDYNYQFDDILNPSLIPSRNVVLSKERLDSCVQYFKNYLKIFVQCGRTPFINPNVYNDAMPSCLEDIYCICASYLSKSPANESLIFCILSNKLSDLVSKHQYCSFEDELGSIQALIIYQIIRLFDGDIRQRGIAEMQFQLLDAWTMQLRQRNELDLHPSVHSSPYRKWLFVESVRRTVLMSIFLRAIYYAIKDGFCDKVPDLSGLPLTVRGELWDVRSEVEWMQATSGCQPDVLTYHEFVTLWNQGSVENDVEHFQRLLLVACIGEEGLQAKFLESLTTGVRWAS